MNARNLKTRLFSIALTAAGLMSMPNAHAWQSIASANAAFDSQFNAQLSSLQQQNNARLQQIWHYHLQVNGPRLRHQYQQLVTSGQAVGTFEQFAYWDLMSAGGRDNAGALAAQQRQFAGNQAAHRTIQSGHASYNSGYWQNQQRTGAVMGRMSDANRGNAAYVDGSGNPVKLPYSLPQGQTVTVSGYTYAQDAQGTYWRYEGQNYWSRVQSR